jgi:arylsulfatase A-like enzyme
MYEESIRMPFLVRWPARIRPGTSSDRMVLNVDFAPTMLEIAGLAVPSDMQGRSFASILDGKEPKDWRRSFYYRYYHYPQHHRVQPHYGVRTEQYKLIYFNRIDEWELYDLRKDPEELSNVYADPAHAGAVKSLKEEMERLRKELDDRDQFATGIADDV